VTLTDTGPLVALLDADDPYHHVCHEAARALPRGPLLTTLPCFTEAMHLLRRAGGHRSQAILWQFRADRKVVVHELTSTELDRAAVLMSRYADAPMDLADATLIAAAERLALRHIFTLDGHFRIYRMPDGSVLEMIPA